MTEKQGALKTKITNKGSVEITFQSPVSKNSTAR